MFCRGTLRYINLGKDSNHPITSMHIPDTVENITFRTRSPIDIYIKYIPSDLKWLAIENIDTLRSLNSVAEFVYFSIVFNSDLRELIDLKFRVLCNRNRDIHKKYARIGTRTVNGRKYDKIINPENYQPKTRAKSARK